MMKSFPFDIPLSLKASFLAAALVLVVRPVALAQAGDAEVTPKV